MDDPLLNLLLAPIREPPPPPPTREQHRGATPEVWARMQERERLFSSGQDWRILDEPERPWPPWALMPGDPLRQPRPGPDQNEEVPDEEEGPPDQEEEQPAAPSTPNAKRQHPSADDEPTPSAKRRRKRADA